MSTRISEDGRIRIAESVAGITGASSLNDTAIRDIEKETFTTDPTLRSWYYGSGWAWDVGNGNMEIA